MHSDETSQPPTWQHIAAVVERLGLGDPTPVRECINGAYSPAARWIAHFEPDERIFIKAAWPSGASEASQQHGLAREALLYRSLHAERDVSSILPRLIAWLPSSSAHMPDVLITEDLSDAHWGVPVTEIDAMALELALNQLAAIPALDALPLLEDDPTSVIVHPRWVKFATDPATLIATGLADSAWCDTYLVTLIETAAQVSPFGDGVVHSDLWRQNWCIASRGAVIVDWTGAARGNPTFNHAWGECAVRAAGGPAGMVLASAHPQHAAWAAWMAGVAAEFLALDHPVRAERPRLIETQRREAIAALRWACDALHIPVPVDMAQIEPAGAWRP